MELKEILASQGLTGEQVDKVIGEMKQNKIFTSAEENIDVRFNKLKTEHESGSQQLKEAQNLIAQLKKDNGTNEALQAKITEYEGTISTLNQQLESQKAESAIKVALLSAKATDIDYLTYKLKEKGEIKLDKDGNIKDLDERIKDLKTAYPAQFENAAKTAGGEGGKEGKKIDVLDLGGKEPGGSGMTRNEFMRKPYMERKQFHQEHPEEYDTLMAAPDDK